MIFSAAATAKTGRTNRRKRIAKYDMPVASFRAIATGKIAVVPPKAERRGSVQAVVSF